MGQKGKKDWERGRAKEEERRKSVTREDREWGERGREIG